MSPRRHQVLICAPDADTDRLVARLQARLNPYYVVQPVSYAALQTDPWEEQCAVLYVVAGDDSSWGYKAGQRIQRYLEQGGRVVQTVAREGPVRPGFGVGDEHLSVHVERSSQRNLVFRIDSASAFTPLEPDSGTVDIRSIQSDVHAGKRILTTLSASELGDTTAILRACDIQLPTVPDESSATSTSTSTPDTPPHRPVWASVPPELLTPTRPLPQLQLVNPEIQQESLGWEIWTTMARLHSPEVDPNGTIVVDDEHDTFHIERLLDSDPPAQVLSSARADARRSSPPLESSARVKKIICPSTLDAASRAMPLFQPKVYFEHLGRLGRIHGLRQRKHASSPETEGWNIGDVVLYGEAVTSTQTMLDKNPKVLRGLPTPFLSLATFQLSGRGRGSNQWLSPPGCLQFSLLLTLPPTFPPNKLVFIQYLAALAICDGLDPDGKLGVCIKWPNDIYAHAEGIGGSAAVGDEGKKGKAKLGGILVNSSLVDGQWRVVVGCGINILNDLPTTSLAQLHDLKARRDARRGGAGQMKQVSMEASLASILVSFEGFWNTFLQDQGFDGLIDGYLGRWLHTDQQVTLTTTTPPQALVIKTITLDHGLLRCIPDRRAESSYLPRSSMYDAGSEDRASYSFADPLARGMQSLGIGKADTGFVDLQPDGNSFDLMSGLIKRKI